MFVSAFLMVMIFGSAYTDAMAQVVSPDPVLSDQIAEGVACGPKLQLPEGTQVVRKEGSLLVTLPPHYFLDFDEQGVPPVLYEDPIAMIGTSGPLASFLWNTTEDEVDCKCTDSESSGYCTEVLDLESNQIYCRRLGGCPDCKMVRPSDDDS